MLRKNLTKEIRNAKIMRVFYKTISSK